ncbi:hypothetical protein [Isobaculum melis]|uniref:LPXTG-motif cell wall anchor domain-containing protein n=1 Tax=Isobaculum melis TaxID=142588 RepID=A0A1H9RJM8_9LACT|nr:hypothetical protein [Isobaculum melis]SER72837.1 hypothetical protein SAMN04488559_10490 [Isobaculum melis]
MKPKKNILVLILLITTMLFAKPVSAAETHLPPGLIIADEKGINADGQGKYFIEATDMEPGDKFTKEISVRNLEEKKPFYLYLQVEPLSNDGKLNLFDKVSLVITYKGNVLYEGNLGGKGNIDISAEKLEIGRFEYGDSEVIEATFTLPGNITSEYLTEKNIANIQWNFTARQDEYTPKEKPEGPKGFLPHTGEEWRNAIYRICAGLFLIAIFLFLLKKKSKKEDEN